MLIIKVAAESIPGGEGAATVPGGTGIPGAPTTPGETAITGVQSLEMSAELLDEAAGVMPTLVSSMVIGQPSLATMMLNRNPGLMTEGNMTEVVTALANNQTFQQALIQEDFFQEAAKVNPEFIAWNTARQQDAVARATP